VEAPAGEPVEGALAHFQLGLAFRQRGYFVEALREYRLALEAGEPPALVREAMAEVHLLKSDHAAAFEIYDELVRERADSPKLWNERGICLHQAGRREEAAASYERALGVDRAYAIAWNNLGVLHGGTPGADAQAAFRTALERQPSLHVARLNLALLLVQRRQLPAALDAYRHVLAADGRNAVAWNGVGFVLMELKRWADARNAFGRAVEADPTLAAAHYHLGFALGQLGDFDGALRATKRALELESYYVAQKFLLATDLQYEEPAITIVPEVATTVGFENLGGEFAFDPAVLDRLFDELTPALPAVEAARPTEDPFGLARDYLSKGLLELATAELTRVQGRGASPVQALTLLGDIFARRGLHGEALERYRAARAAEPDGLPALLGELRSLVALGREADGVDAAELAVQLAPRDVDAQVAAARIRLAVGDLARALDAVRAARALAPGRADLLHLQARAAARLGDRAQAIEACRAALQLDESLVPVWLDLGRFEEERGRLDEAAGAYAAALELLPTYVDASLALGDLLLRRRHFAAAMDVLVDALSANPYELEALVLLGRVLLEQGRLADAESAFARVIRFDPEHLGALFHVGEAWARDRRFAEAVEAWDRIIQLDAAGPLAAQARIRARSARDLEHILSARAE
jgi:tetratricopeptide (TPR) repeat protein